jgi:peptidoglycan/LPS O-acetylase OafA/YrhL
MPWWCRFEFLGTVVGFTLLLSAALIRPPAAPWLAEMAFAMMTCPWLLMLAMRKSSSKLDHLAGYLSYGIFLVHIPVIRFAHFKGESALQFVIALAAATAISFVIHWVVEKPILRWRHRRADHAPMAP